MSEKRFHRAWFRVVAAAVLSLAFIAPLDASAKSARSKRKKTRSARAVLKFAPATPFSTVIIDAGHGGFDRGGIRQNIIPEKDVALDVAQRLQKSLKKSGFKTAMMRSDDRFRDARSAGRNRERAS